MAAFDALADLPLRVDDYALEGLARDVSSDFTRKSTVIRLRGARRGGRRRGRHLRRRRPTRASRRPARCSRWRATGRSASFCDHVEGLDLWPEPPASRAFAHYRLWAYESAALDLALRQAGVPLHAALGREARPVTFVVSLRLGEPPSFEPLRRILDRYPTTALQARPDDDWTPALADEIQATGAVDSVDLKGLYTGTPVDQGADPALYRARRRGVPPGVDRGPAPHRRDRPDPRAAPRPHHVGREHPLGRRHRGRCRSRRRW